MEHGQTFFSSVAGIFTVWWSTWRALGTIDKLSLCISMTFSYTLYVLHWLCVFKLFTPVRVAVWGSRAAVKHKWPGKSQRLSSPGNRQHQSLMSTWAWRLEAFCQELVIDFRNRFGCKVQSFVSHFLVTNHLVLVEAVRLGILKMSWLSKWNGNSDVLGTLNNASV